MLGCAPLGIMTLSAVVDTNLTRSDEAGASLGRRIRESFPGERPDAVILFASPRYDFPPLLQALDAECRPRTLVGCSSAGEFTTNVNGEGMACAVALRAPEMQFHAGVGRQLSLDREAAAQQAVSSFTGMGRHDFAFRSALVFADALAGHSEELVEELNILTGGLYRFVGGGAGGDAEFQRRFVFCGTEAIPDAVVVLEILSNKPLGIGVRHGWSPSGGPLRVTAAEGMRLDSLNAVAAEEVFQEHAERTGQTFDRHEPFPFFLHNVLGVDTGAGHKLRVPLSVNADSSVQCATEVAVGSAVQIMNVSTAAAANAAAESTRDAVSQLQGGKPAVAIFFDCVATRLRMGKEFDFELDAVRATLGDAQFAGCNSIGQIARSEGQMSGFHNCTAVVCVIPE
jgi:hypothetical protein